MLAPEIININFKLISEYIFE